MAIGEYGTDVLVGLFDTTKITNTNGRNKCHTISGEDHEAIELEIRGFLSYYKNIYCNTFNTYNNINIIGAMILVNCNANLFVL